MIGDYSYDLDMDKRLSEETTTLVESYTVGLTHIPSDLLVMSVELTNFFPPTRRCDSSRTDG